MLLSVSFTWQNYPILFMREFLAREYDNLIGWLTPSRFIPIFCFLLWLEFHILFGYGIIFSVYSYASDYAVINVPVWYDPYYGIHGFVTREVRRSYFIGYVWANAMFLLFWTLERRNLYFRENTVTNPDYHLVGF